MSKVNKNPNKIIFFLRFDLDLKKKKIFLLTFDINSYETIKIRFYFIFLSSLLFLSSIKNIVFKFFE